MSQTTNAFNSASATWEEHRAAFFGAIQNNDSDTILTVLEKYPEAVEWQDKKGQRPLRLAFDNKNHSLFLLLLDNGASPNQESALKGWEKFVGGIDKSILNSAIEKGAKDYIIPLLQYGASTHNAFGLEAPKSVRYEIVDLLKRAEIIRKEFLASQKVVQPAQAASAAANPANEQEIEVLKPVKVKNKAAAKTP